MTKNPQFHGPTKHIDIKYHFIREQVNSGNFKISVLFGNDMVANNMFTKPLGHEQFCKRRSEPEIMKIPLTAHSQDEECWSM